MIKKRYSRPVRRPEYWVVLGSVCAVSICFYGLRAAAVCGLAVLTAVATDFVCLFLRGRSYRMIDLSNAGFALILAMMFPATIPYSILILSTIFATVFGAHVFGYRRDLIIPPPAIGYLFALISWPKSVLQFPPVGAGLQLFNNPEDLTESVSAVMNREGSLKTDLYDILLGFVRTPMGTGCVLLLIVGTGMLLFRRQLDPWKLLGCLLGLSLSLLVSRFTLFELLAANMVLFSMLFLLCDPAVSPCAPVPGYIGAAVGGLLIGHMITVYRIEYAPVICVILICPLWRGLDLLQKQLMEYIGKRAGEVQEDEDGE